MSIKLNIDDKLTKNDSEKLARKYSLNLIKTVKQSDKKDLTSYNTLKEKNTGTNISRDESLDIDIITRKEKQKADVDREMNLSLGSNTDCKSELKQEYKFNKTLPESDSKKLIHYITSIIIYFFSNIYNILKRSAVYIKDFFYLKNKKIRNKVESKAKDNLQEKFVTVNSITSSDAAKTFEVQRKKDMQSKDKYNLKRFLNVQRKVNDLPNFEAAYQEIKRGKKNSHWIWYIFPQIKIPIKNASPMSIKYSIKSLNEAKDFLKNEYLSNNLKKSTRALLDNVSDMNNFCSNIDQQKIKSCMTLFYYASDNEIEKQLFKKVIDKYYEGEFDKNTVKELNKH